MKIKVAIIEDDEDLSEAFAEVINKSEKFCCNNRYSNAEDALKYITDENCLLVIMDLNLPGISGIECTKILTSKFPSILVLICTVFEEDSKIFDALTAGAQGYITKSSFNTITEALEEIMNGGSPISGSIARKVISFFQENNAQEQLSVREQEILNLYLDGYKIKEIADKLFISKYTVKNHIQNIYKKLHINSKIEAANIQNKNLKGRRSLS